ncbi:MAG: DUF2249 domain-containing protein [Gammaproteobacteria bacterium]|nr:DUF2249 domain-containing protein [Gammaproteobacteria bacterium]
MEQRLDVSMLEPCEPLNRSIEAVRVLNVGDYLKIIHRREPLLLYPMLQELDFSWHAQQVDDSIFHIFVWKNGDAIARDAALSCSA